MKSTIVKNISILSAIGIFGVVANPCYSKINKSPDKIKADVVVYGGTSSAVIAAVQATKMGKKAILVSPEKHLGGLSSSGLGWTDTGNKKVIGGLSRDFYHRVYLQYQKPENWNWQKQSEYGNKGQGNVAMDGKNRTMWIFEPHVAENVFELYIKEFNIPVYRDEWLDREEGVKKEGLAITSITTLSGREFEAKAFIDATYEGDLLASAGCSYHVGREACDQYNEKWNGNQVGILHHGNHFESDVSPYVIPGDPQSGLLPRISTDGPGVRCDEDNKLQAYCFRLCLTKYEENRLPFSKPKGYDPYQYELLVRIYDGGWRRTFHRFDPIPNWKTDVNNHGPFGFDNIGMNYDYPEADYMRRSEIVAEHTTYQQGLLYFLATDTRIPADVQKEIRKWGYSKDEFTDHGHWPYKIYVREARRLIGEYVMTENEVLGKTKVHEPIGMGAYTMDSHNTQRYIKADGFVQNEGDIGVHPHEPYQIDRGSVLPKKEECTNLVVPICVSSSHIAFGSIRMEPVFMILGQSAAVIACIAVDEDQVVQDVSYEKIKDQLLKEGQVLEYTP